MGALKLHEHDALRAAHDDAVAALLRLANLRDDHGLPSMGLDSMRREVQTLKSKLVANDNHSINQGTGT